MSDSRGPRTDSRAQSHVVGVVLLLGITAVALGGLTALVGSVVDAQTEAADGARVASALDDELRPTQQTGPGRVRLRFSEGRVETVQRDLRLLAPSGVVERVPVGALVYGSGSTRVAAVGGAVVRGRPGNAWLVRGPPVTVTRDEDALVVGAVALNESGVAVAGSGGVTVTVRTNVTHHHRRLPRRDYRVALETATPGPVARHFDRVGADTRTVDLDGDGVPSVVASVEGRQRVELVVHAVGAEVADG
ncbi:DUF7289 family protein [Haloarcula litorea]|uniref:DUF7289 family protein n=1 Tax=Haloarcula litorea TaxID=3032579 RepID=UPI0023E8E0D1|nr:type IV pilin [Halomicroarcula sp. GDY20]